MADISQIEDLLYLEFSDRVLTIAKKTPNLEPFFDSGDDDDFLRLVIELFRFFILKVRERDFKKNEKVSPSYPVDQLWHALLTHTKLYQEFCHFITQIQINENHFIHHDPGTKDDPDRDHRYERTFALYTEIFGTEPIKQFWPAETWKQMMEN